MPNINDYHAFKSTTGGSGGESGRGPGCGGLLLMVFVVILACLQLLV